MFQEIKEVEQLGEDPSNKMKEHHQEKKKKEWKNPCDVLVYEAQK